jgi:hypothetical protein
MVPCHSQQKPLGDVDVDNAEEHDTAVACKENNIATLS